jgi:hypothetical protein
MENQIRSEAPRGIGTTDSLTLGRVDVQDHKFTGVAMNHTSVQAAPLQLALPRIQLALPRICN